MADLMTEFIRQNEWANLRLIEACRDLTEEQLDETVEGTYGSLRSTFLHILRAEGGYAAQLGNEPSDRLRAGDSWPGWDTLEQKARQAADALAGAIEPWDRKLHFHDQGEEVKASVVLVQAYHHGTDHRSQICTILTQVGVDPPDLSSWSWGLDTGRLVITD